MSQSHFSKRLQVVSAMLLMFLFSNVCAADEANTDLQSPQENTVTTTTIQPSADGTSATKTVETHRTVITTIPAPNADAEPPAGFISCATVGAAWQNDVWIPAHKICKYENAPEGVAWIEGYWKCTKATAEGACTVWEWQTGQWQK